MKRDRYDSYHGRNRFATAFKVLIAVLALILLAALAALFFLEPYIVYSSDGVRIELPFFRDEEPPALPQIPVENGVEESVGAEYAGIFSFLGVNGESFSDIERELELPETVE